MRHPVIINSTAIFKIKGKNGMGDYAKKYGERRKWK